MAKTKQYPHVEKGMQYVSDVLDGTVEACKYIKLACQRHIDDLAKQSDPHYPYYFDPVKAERFCRFASMMIHTKGKWARKRLVFEPWQLFAFVSVFGWMKRSTHKRRFTEASLFVPRKNGKSAMSAALGNYMLVADGEAGAEVYSVASTEKQAWEVFGPARFMSLWNEEYKNAFGITVGAKNLSVLSSGSKFEPLIGSPGDGSSPHCAIIDEEHEHKTPDAVDTMATGMGSREQPLLWRITTAGTNISGPCYSNYCNCIKVLEGVIERPDVFVLIFTIDEGDDWKDFSVWEKANPNYGVSLNEEFLYKKYCESMQNAEKQNINKCKHLNVWANAAIGWINMAKWEACADPTLQMGDFKDVPCWVGVDLASKIDLAAMMFLFKIPNTGQYAEFLQGQYVLFGKYYLPEETIERPENAHYRAWRDLGLLTQTPGARTDFAYLKEDLRKFVQDEGFIVKELAYDPREAEYLMQDIRECEWASFPCVEVSQSPAYLSEPMKEFEALYLSGNLKHNGCPLLKWQASNVIKKNSRNKSYYPAKERAENKIDGIVASITALSRAMAHVDETASFGIEVW